MIKRKSKKAYGGTTTGRPQRMTSKAGVTVKKKRLGCGGKLK